MNNIEYGLQRLKNIVEKEAEGEAKEHQQGDYEQYNMVPKIKLVYEGKRVKQFTVTWNLNSANTKMIMDNITPYVDMRAKVIYLLKSEIHRGAGAIVDYGKTLTSPPGMFASLEEIQAYIEECEQKPFDLENEEVWSKAYLPATEQLRHEKIIRAKWFLSMLK